LDLDQLKRLLDLVREHDLSEFEIEHEGLKLKIKKDGTRPPSAQAHSSALPAISDPPVVAAATVPQAEGATEPVADSGEGVELAVVKSPIVGTFYRFPEPDAPPFVEIGSIVKKGQVLCIIEAMKLMNEIDSEYDGVVVNVYVENGQPVQYGERLFAIRPM
jgi:acetyl-CoA carboxylase biotin carboxyl carrier protein